jgi:hypothetical protein
VLPPAPGSLGVVLLSLLVGFGQLPSRCGVGGPFAARHSVVYRACSTYSAMRCRRQHCLIHSVVPGARTPSPLVLVVVRGGVLLCVSVLVCV